MVDLAQLGTQTSLAWLDIEKCDRILRVF